MFYRGFRVIIALAAVVMLSGAKCAFFFSSGGDSSDPEKENDEDAGLVVVIREGRLVDAPVVGVNYESGALSGITGSAGEFQYEEGSSVRFSIGDVALGRAVGGKALITPLDLVTEGDADTPAVINIARLLQSLDSDREDGVITIPPAVRAAALRSNGAISAAVEFLDFSDEQAFVNAASQLVAVLTGDYPFTAVLVDAETARARMLDAIRSATGERLEQPL
jgi:hypothetical protein